MYFYRVCIIEKYRRNVIGKLSKNLGDKEINYQKRISKLSLKHLGGGGSEEHTV